MTILTAIRPKRFRNGIRTKVGRPRSRTLAVASAMVLGTAGAADPQMTTLTAYAIVGDGIPVAFAPAIGDAARGRTLVEARDPANCVLCHAVPDAAVRFAGDVGPSLAGVGARLDAAQLRLRLADNLRVNPHTVMPSYYKADGLDRVGPAYRGKPILTAQQLEDVVAYLGTLR